MKFCVFAILNALLSISHGYKILFLAPMNGRSHWIFLEHIIKELLRSGHEISCITSLTLSDRPATSTNYTEILIDPPFDFENLLPQELVYKASIQTPFLAVHQLSDIGKKSADYAFQNEAIQKFIQRNDLHFDLVINEEFYHDSFLMFAHKFNAPSITISTYGTSDFFDRQMGLLTPWSHVPHMVLSYTDNMLFWDRFYNTALSLYDWIHRKLVHLPQQMEIAKKYFAHLEPLPTMEELLNRVSVILVNSHRSVQPPRPTMPGVINIGGAHIKPAKQLPADLKQFIDESKYGVIYFSLGTFLKSSKMPKAKLNVFLETFRGLKQRILWKFEDNSLTNIPSNVMIRKWMPQADILAHKNVILFISHGGMFGNFEAIARGIPMILIPFYGDQYRNALRATATGYGKIMNFDDLTNESLKDAVNEMITNQSYANKAKEMSSIYVDNLVHPLDEAIFWIEYVCRHKGAQHLKSHAVNMSGFSYLLLDILCVSGILIGFLFSLLYLTIKFVFCGGNGDRKPNEMGKNKKKN